jgi:Phosphotransferase enzyme family
MTLTAQGAGGPEVNTAELCAALEAGLVEHLGRRCRIVRCDRRPSAFQTSYALQELDVELDDGVELAVLFKHVGQHALTEAARRIKPAFVLDPQREIEAYRRILAPNGQGTPICYAAVSEPDGGRYWLFVERVRGAHLWQFGELEVWRSVARWLAGFHTRCAPMTALASYAGAPLVHDATFYRTWVERAWRFVSSARGQRTDRLGRFARLVERYDSVVERLEQLPRTLVHGEFFASNVLVAASSATRGAPLPRVCPIDWELLGSGPGLFDLAAVTAGWPADAHDRIALAYFDEQRGTGWYTSPGDLLEALDVCHLQLSMQMLGWAEDWRPPRQHRQDWLGIAMGKAARLGIVGPR